MYSEMKFIESKFDQLSFEEVHLSDDPTIFVPQRD